MVMSDNYCRPNSEYWIRPIKMVCFFFKVKLVVWKGYPSIALDRNNYFIYTLSSDRFSKQDHLGPSLSTLKAKIADHSFNNNP